MNNYKKISTLFLLHAGIAFSLNAGGYMGLSIPMTNDDYQIESLDNKSGVNYYGEEKNSATGVGVEIFGGYGFTDFLSGEVSFKYANVSQFSANLKYGYDFFGNGIHPFALLGAGIPMSHRYEVDTKAIPYTGGSVDNSFKTTFPVKIGIGSSYVIDENYVLRAGLNYVFAYDLRVDKGDADADVDSNLHVNHAIELYVGISYDFSNTPTYTHYEQILDDAEEQQWEEEEDLDF